ncbi:hypothetical protein M405DRAFT_753771 [Rhizopogon salebrosus TDB-379]|nr:hypothetical protein M405DRAFT_753771 [Rhizopogon salebrosus TDB-379]
MSENLSSPNLRAANSKRYDLYFCSVSDVRLDAKPIGCSFSIHCPLGVRVRVF